MTLSDALRDELSTTVSQAPVVLFMKGKRRMPQCGFSAQVVQILDELLEDYATVNVLENPEVREGIKAFSNWPTIPQLYVNGQFVGGCDIVVQMYQQGELHETLGIELPDARQPRISVTPAAAEKLLEAIQQAGPGHRVRLAVNASFRPGLDVDGPRPGDFELESQGVPLVVDRMSATRADGITIDFLAGLNAGFRIENPNEPPRVREVDAKTVAGWQKDGPSFEFLDVRTPEERATAEIPGTVLWTDAERARVEQLPKDTPIVLHCHHGSRSLEAAQSLVDQGFRRVFNLRGGIDAWSTQVDDGVPRY